MVLDISITGIGTIRVRTAVSAKWSEIIRHDTGDALA